jgi:hypothetical protein
MASLLSQALIFIQKIKNRFIAKHDYPAKYCLGRTRRFFVIGGSGVILALLAATGIAGAQTVVQSYASTGNVQNDMIVSLANGQSDTVTPATTATLKKIFGVTVSPADTSAILSPGSSSGQSVYVATSGTYEVLVSNQNGAINVGDYITVSSLDGIGMKTGSTEAMVLGKALAAFNGRTNVTNTATLTDGAGKKITVSLTAIPVDVNIIQNPQLNQAPDLPGFLRHITQTVTNKPVDAVRAYISLGVLVITLVVVGIMLYSGVRSTIISIGRNPLSKRSIMSGLLGVGLTAMAIFIVGLIAVYLLLKL